MNLPEFGLGGKDRSSQATGWPTLLCFPPIDLVVADRPSVSQAGRCLGAVMQNREEIAKRFGFTSFEELLVISDPIPKKPGQNTQSYIARGPDGKWHIWNDPPSSEVEPPA